jgi:hypothetical protein
MPKTIFEYTVNWIMDNYYFQDKQSYLDFYDSLTSEENSAIISYIEASYADINQNLRLHDTDPIGDIIIDIMHRTPLLDTNTVLYRAVDDLHYPLDAEIILKGLVSTTVDPTLSGSPLTSNSKILIIFPSDNTHGIPIHEMGEQEVILGHALKAMITMCEPYAVNGVEYESYEVTLR